MKILIVCLGNICRSPLAEGVLKKKAKEHVLDWTIESAGTNGYHTGEPPHHLSQKVAKCNGVDISGQVSRKFIAKDFEDYDLIYVMAQDVLDDIKKISGKAFDPAKTKFFLDELYPDKNMDVPDPWYGDEDGYHEVYKIIEETCDAIIKNYNITSKQTGKYRSKT